ncbi:MAG TPA: MFS transporter [Chloroflexia bacterium]|nr:MFS transporter [Chloroflexia bacterium]
MVMITPEEMAAPSELIPSPPAQEDNRSALPQGLSAPLMVVIGSSFLLRLAGGSTGLLIAVYLKQVVRAEADQIGFLAAIFYLSELLLAPVFGALSDIRGRRFFLILGPLVGAIALPVYPITTVFVFLALGRMLEGVSTAAKVPSALGYLADATSGSGKANAALRGRVMGMYEISFLVGLVGGNVLGGLLGESVGTNGFYIISMIYLLTAAILFFFVPESLPEAAREHHTSHREAAREAQHPVRTLLVTRYRSYLQLMKEPALISFMPAWLAINAVVGLWSIHIQPLMIRSGAANEPNRFAAQLLDGNFSQSQVGFLVGGFGMLFMVGIYIWSLFYAHLRKTTMMIASILGLFLVAVSMLGINNHAPGFPPPWEEWPLTPLLAAGILLVSGFTPVALAYLAEISEHRVEHRGAVMGLYSVLLGLGQLIGGAGGGVFIRTMNIGFNGLILATFILAVVAIVTVFRLRAKYGV